jgi:hypothetical protein
MANRAETLAQNPTKTNQKAEGRVAHRECTGRKASRFQLSAVLKGLDPSGLPLIPKFIDEVFADFCFQLAII